MRGSGLSRPIPGSVLQTRFKMLHILFADCGLLREPVELRAKNGGLKFSQTIIEADNSVMKLVCKTGAAGVDVALHQLHIFKIIGDDGAAFSGGDELARLETERAKIAHRAGTFTLPHAAVGVRAIFDNFQIVFFGDAQDFVHVGEAHPEVDWENCFGLWE